MIQVTWRSAEDEVLCVQIFKDGRWDREEDWKNMYHHYVNFGNIIMSVEILDDLQ